MGLFGFWQCGEFGLHARFESLCENDSVQILHGRNWRLATYHPTELDFSSSIAEDGSCVGLMSGQFFESESGLHRSSQIDLSSFKEGSKSAKLPWGRWSAAAIADHGDSLFLGRDSLGMERFFVTKIGNGYVFATSMPILFALIGRTPSFNWDYLASYIAYGAFPRYTTGFDGIYELPQGSIMWYRTNTSPRRYIHWDPYSVASISRPVPSAEEIRETLVGCVRAWVGSKDRFAVDLSGGLDSSSVAWAMCKADVEVTAMHLEDPRHAAVQEWEYASAVGHKLEIEVRRLSPPALSLPRLRSLDGLPKYDSPTPKLLLREEYEQRANMVPNAPLVKGVGGDEVFYSNVGQQYFHDAVIHGNYRNFGSALAFLSKNTGAPITAILGNTIGDEVTRWVGGRPLLKRSLFRRKPFMAPWIASNNVSELDPRLTAASDLTHRIPRLSSAKLTHVVAAALCTTMASAYALNRTSSTSQQVLYPILSQPIVELLLATPISVVNAGAQDRGLLRTAMHGHLPEIVLKRHSKADYGGRYQRGLRFNYGQALELITEGAMVEQGVVSKQLAVQHLRDSSLGYNAELDSILNLLAVELWIHSWESSS